MNLILNIYYNFGVMHVQFDRVAISISGVIAVLLPKFQ